jgi:hypothetical protein
MFRITEDPSSGSLVHHHHLSVTQLGHLLTRSGLTYPEVSSEVCHDSFWQLGNKCFIILGSLFARLVQCLAKNYKNDCIVSVDMDNGGVMAAYCDRLCVCVCVCV